MTKRQFILGLVVWILVLAFGAKWAANPILWNGPMLVTPGRIVSEFPIRLARLPQSAVSGHSARIENEDLESPADFDAGDWCFRETRARGILVLGFWSVTGFFLHWFVGRILRGQADLT